jgi:hypothetical protein
MNVKTTEALILALEDVEADSGNTEALDAYLRENFLEGELMTLANAAEHLSTRAYRAVQLMRSGR